MKKIVRESLFEEEERFSGAYVPPKYQAANNRADVKKKSGIAPRKKGNILHRGKASKEEFAELISRANDKKEKSIEYSVASYGKQVRPFKELVTDSGLFSKFDTMDPEAVRKRLLYQLDAVNMNNDIRVYIEDQIINANTKIKLANLVMKYTTGLMPKNSSSDFNGMKSFNLNVRNHDPNGLRELDRIRRVR